MPTHPERYKLYFQFDFVEKRKELKLTNYIIWII
jgi:hypothetical protein